jgi:hypothetical protein
MAIVGDGSGAGLGVPIQPSREKEIRIQHRKRREYRVESIKFLLKWIACSMACPGRVCRVCPSGERLCEIKLESSKNTSVRCISKIPQGGAWLGTVYYFT